MPREQSQRNRNKRRKLEEVWYTQISGASVVCHGHRHITWREWRGKKKEPKGHTTHFCGMYVSATLFSSLDFLSHSWESFSPGEEKVESKWIAVGWWKMCFFFFFDFSIKHVQSVCYRGTSSGETAPLIGVVCIQCRLQEQARIPEP